MEALLFCQPPVCRVDIDVFPAFELGKVLLIGEYDVAKTAHRRLNVIKQNSSVRTTCRCDDLQVEYYCTCATVSWIYFKTYTPEMSKG